MDGSNIYHMIVRNDNSLTINAMQRHYLEFIRNRRASMIFVASYMISM